MQNENGKKWRKSNELKNENGEAKWKDWNEVNKIKWSEGIDGKWSEKEKEIKQNEKKNK